MRIGPAVAIAAAFAALLPAPARAAHPRADFTWAPAAPHAGESVVLTSTSTPGKKDPISATLWDFDGDNAADASGTSVTTTFAAPGAYAVRLQVIDQKGKSATAVHPITVDAAATVQAAPPPPAGSPAPTPTSTGAGAGTAVGAPASEPSRAAAPAIVAPQMTPFPIVRIAGRIVRRGVVISLLTVHAPPGALVRVACRGRGCPRRAVVRRARSRRVVRLRSLERRLGVGAVLEVFVTDPAAIGKYTRFRVRRGAAPLRRDLCVPPGGRRPAACPGG